MDTAIVSTAEHVRPPPTALSFMVLWFSVQSSRAPGCQQSFQTAEVKVRGKNKKKTASLGTVLEKDIQFLPIIQKPFQNNSNISCSLRVKVPRTSAKRPNAALTAFLCVKCHKFSQWSSTKLVQGINLTAHKSHLLLYVGLVFRHSPQSINAANCQNAGGLSLPHISPYHRLLPRGIRGILELSAFANPP